MDLTVHTHVYTVLMGSYCTYTRIHGFNMDLTVHTHVYTVLIGILLYNVHAVYTVCNTHGILLYIHTYTRF